MNALLHRRSFDFETYDRIELVVTPRFKESGFSGDEWRTSVSATFYFKGEIAHTATFRDMRTAISLLSSTMPEFIPNLVIETEKTKCDQPGCSDDAVNRFQIRRLTSERGEYLDMEEQAFTYYRQFCEKHSERGDASREDCDDNYTKLDKNVKRRPQ